MSDKTASKAKAKPLYASALKKKAGKLHSGAHKPPGLKLHDAGYGVKFAGVASFGAESTATEDEAELAGKLVAGVADTSGDVKELCDTYQLGREELGRLTGFSLRALAAWHAGELPSRPAKRRLHEVRRLLDALAEIVKPEHIPNWLHQRNRAFDNLTPLQVIELGEIDRLWAMVYDLGSGQPS